MKNAIIVGHTGQDGTYLYNYLIAQNYKVIGISSKKTTDSSQKSISPISISKYQEISTLINKYKPAEIYYLAAVHQSSTEKTISNIDLINKSFEVNVLGAANFLDAIKEHSPSTRFFYAASSHIFGNPDVSVQNENTPYKPICIYGTSKVAGMNLCNYFKNTLNTFASVGIFYNHESPIRAPWFVSKKIVETAVAIKRGRKNKLILGDLDAKVDWGFAGDYVKAAHKILQHNTPDTFIIGSGTTHSIKEFVSKTFDYLQLDWKDYVETNSEIISKVKRNQLCSNIEKIKNDIRWYPETSFNDLIELMINEELKK